MEQNLEQNLYQAVGYTRSYFEQGLNLRSGVGCGPMSALCLDPEALALIRIRSRVVRDMHLQVLFVLMQTIRNKTWAYDI